MGIGITWDKEKFEQEAEVQNQLQQIRDGLDEAVKAEIEAVLQKILARAIELCPKDTGSLASSINLEFGTISAGDFADYQIYAGREDVINPKSGLPTSTYALMVHDGHAMPDGSFWEGVPFLQMAYDEYADELEACIDKALAKLGADIRSE